MASQQPMRVKSRKVVREGGALYDHERLLLKNGAPRPTHVRRLAVSLAAIVIVVLLIAVPETSGYAFISHASRIHAEVGSPSTPIFPSGIPDDSEPSGEAPPSPTGFPGYVETYEQDFSGTTLPTGWTTFDGTDSLDNDTGEQFASTHDVVGDGVLSLNTWMDPAYGDEWVTGGLCRCQDSNTYGAYLVRSRQTGPGPTVVFLLWPTDQVWPPEIDFNETVGVTNATTATVIWGDSGGQRLQSQVPLNIDMTLWHTWGVIWTPTTILFTVDGKVWGQFSVASEIPNVPMTLHLQTQTWCVFNYACPTGPQSTLVDWVAEFSAVSDYTKSIGTFAPSKWVVNSNLRSQISGLANVINALGDPSVNLVGYSDSSTLVNRSGIVSEHRAEIVKSSLRRDLDGLGDTNVVITITASKVVKPSTFNSTPAWRSRNATVEVTLHNPNTG